MIQTNQSLIQSLPWLTQSSSMVRLGYIFSFRNTLNDRLAEQEVAGMMLRITTAVPKYGRKLNL